MANHDWPTNLATPALRVLRGASNSLKSVQVNAGHTHCRARWASMRILIAPLGTCSCPPLEVGQSSDGRNLQRRPPRSPDKALCAITLQTLAAAPASIVNLNAYQIRPIGPAKTWPSEPYIRCVPVSRPHLVTGAGPVQPCHMGRHSWSQQRLDLRQAHSPIPQCGGLHQVSQCFTGPYRHQRVGAGLHV